jgi:hypothetical protein
LRSIQGQQQTQQSTIWHTTIVAIMSASISSTESSIVKLSSNVVVIDVDNNKHSEAERAVLFGLCIGLEETNDDGTKKPLLDFNKDPFKNLKKKDRKPSVDCLRDEVRRQSGLAALAKVPKPNGWNIAKCFNWLEKHPLSNNNDVAFLQRKAKEARQVAFNATNNNTGKDSSTHQQSNGDAKSGNRWTGQLPYLCLIHCLLEDDIKDRWIHRNDPKSIQKIDARRSVARQETAFEMIANCWNETKKISNNI